MPKISALTSATALDADDEFYVVEDGNSRKITAAALAEYVEGEIDAPIKPTSVSGPGNFVLVNPSVGNAATLPSGGKWAYALYRFSSGITTTASIGVADGGLTIGAAASGQNWIGFAWRVE